MEFDPPPEPEPPTEPDVEPPYWFEQALKDAPTSHHIQVLDCDIHYLRWGPEVAERPGLLFIHGAGCHAHWWDFIAPFFSPERPVAAIDLSGMGDSGWRQSYGSECHVPEIAAVLADAKLGEKPIIVGHSFGGYMTMCYGKDHGAELTGAVIVDSPLRPENRPSGDKRRIYDPPKRPPNRVFTDREEMVQRFRTIPPQYCDYEYIMEHIARTSLKECEGGYTWKFDPSARVGGLHDEPLEDYLRAMPCRKAMVWGADSAIFGPDVADYMSPIFGPANPMICVPDAQHHIAMDQPLAFVTALRAIFAGWGV
ncbi:MAG: alpha/beta hydrolase [Alphaproteobacteria bacterium]